MTTPDPTFADVVRIAGRSYDAEARLLRMPTYQNVHTEHLDGSERHPIRESLYYALALLAGGGAESAARASEVIERVLGLQEGGDPESPLYGLWHYFAEEAVTAWPLPDKNWADFNGMSLLLILQAGGERLDPGLRARIAEALRRAALCIRRRDVSLHYTNIAIKGALVTLGTAELLGDAGLFAYGMDRLERLHALLLASEGIAEYNSPPYAGVCLGVLMAFRLVVRDGRARDLARDIEHRFWNHLAPHMHLPTGELAGPHSRAYHLTLREAPGTLGYILGKVCGGSLRYGAEASLEKDPFGPLYALLFQPDLPEEARLFLGDAGRRQEVRETTQRFSQGGAAAITTWIEPAFCLGTVNFENSWEQRHNLISYWPGARTTGILRQTYLHDERPCCSGFFAAAQSEGKVLFAGLVGAHADHHVSFRVDGVRAAFLGPVIEIESGGEPGDVVFDSQPLADDGEVEWREGAALAVRLPGVWIFLKLLRHRAPHGGERPGRLFREGSRLRAAVAHYRGPVRDITWAEAGPAHTCWALAMSAPQADWEAWRRALEGEPSEQGEGESGIDIAWSGLRLALPPGVPSEETMRGFYR